MSAGKPGGTACAPAASMAGAVDITKTFSLHEYVEKDFSRHHPQDGHLHNTVERCRWRYTSTLAVPIQREDGSPMRIPYVYPTRERGYALQNMHETHNSDRVS